MSRKTNTRIAVALVAVMCCGGGTMAQTAALTSIDTGYTISKVRTAAVQGKTHIIAGTYEGTLLGIGPGGACLWTNELSGYMNRDLWCADLTRDGSDEILAANADGALYCLDSAGVLQWTFRTNDAPMNAVTVVHGKDTSYVVCGGYDMNMYYLSATGDLVKTIPSSAYSKERPWGKGPKPVPPPHRHIANFLRPLRRADGTEALALHGALNSNAARGSVYLFEPLAEEPYRAFRIAAGGPVGEVRTGDIDGDGNDEILTGSSGMIQDAAFTRIDPDTNEQTTFELSSIRRRIGRSGYRVLQPEKVTLDGRDRFLVLFGSQILLMSTKMEDEEVLSCDYAFNDLWRDGNRIILASAQSGGSCVHVIDLDQPGWKDAYRELAPPGKIAAILENTTEARGWLTSFNRPAWEREPLPVYFLSDRKDRDAAEVIRRIERDYASPVFLNYVFLNKVENIDRRDFDPVYREKRDRRKQYTQTSEQMVNALAPGFEGHPGLAYWGGHGNDPFQTSLQTQRRVFDAAGGKKTVTIYPELEQHDEHFAWVMEHYFYPLAECARGRNAHLFIRSKHAFWHSIVYLPMWHGLVSGDYADVFIPALEETTDKTMEQSVAARMGLWASGAVNQWGARCARDNTSYDRLRQYSHQELPNHFLRQMIYNTSCGATYLNNLPVDQEYMSLLWELIARGAIYVPRRSELVSLSPVHLGMAPPDPRFLGTGNNVKWLTLFDEEEEKNNPMVFSRLNGTWPGAPVTAWDFSRYAAGVKERRLNYLPTYEHGIVMLAPPQNGVYADRDAPRGRMVEHLHPMYRNIMKEYLCDGRNYLSPDGERTFAADRYYEVIEADIAASAALLPLTVSGDVAWVAAQTDPTHLRLTLIDGGYINPSTRTAVVRCRQVQPVRVTDLLSGETFDISDPSSITITVPCGLFRFLDVELAEPWTGRPSPMDPSGD